MKALGGAVWLFGDAGGRIAPPAIPFCPDPAAVGLPPKSSSMIFDHRRLATSGWSGLGEVGVERLGESGPRGDVGGSGLVGGTAVAARWKSEAKRKIVRYDG